MSPIQWLIGHYRSIRYRNRPQPVVRVSLGHTAPVWAVRGVAAILECLLVILPGHNAHLPLPAIVVFCIGMAAWTLGHPAHSTGLVGIVLAALQFLWSDPPLWLGILAALAGYAGWRLCTVSGLAGWRGRIQLGALFTVRDLVILLVSAVIGMLALIPIGWPLTLSILGAFALVGLGIAVFRPGTPDAD
jgi:hypothetical protein